MESYREAIKLIENNSKKNIVLYLLYSNRLFNVKIFILNIKTQYNDRNQKKIKIIYTWA